MKAKPWEILPKVWPTESKFWTWVRGVLRKGWSRHPLKLEYIRLNRKRIINPDPKKRVRFPTVWGMTCEICEKDHAQSNIEIDHKGLCGTFRGLDDVKDYVEHLFLVSFESLRALCKGCHKIVNYSQRSGSSFEEAKIAKKVIEYSKLPKEELLAYLNQKGYNNDSVSNDKKRREVLRKIFEEMK